MDSIIKALKNVKYLKFQIDFKVVNEILKLNGTGMEKKGLKTTAIFPRKC